MVRPSQRLSQQIYESAAQAGDTSGDAGEASGGGDDDVVDAEIVEDEDDS